MSATPDVNEKKILFTQQAYTIGSSSTLIGPNRIASAVIQPPFVSNRSDRNRVWLDRISATLNQEIGATVPVTPATSGSLRAYFVPYSGIVCKIETDPNELLRFQTFARLQRRVPIVGWYPNDVGPRELNDTNFGEGHQVPRELGGDWYAIVLLSQIDDALQPNQNFEVQLSWRSEPMKENEVWAA